MPILNIALTSNVLPMTRVDEYGQTFIAQRLSMIEGVASVGVYGSAKYAVRVQLDPAQLAVRNIGVSQVARPSATTTSCFRPACCTARTKP